MEQLQKVRTQSLWLFSDDAGFGPEIQARWTITLWYVKQAVPTTVLPQGDSHKQKLVPAGSEGWRKPKRAKGTANDNCELPRESHSDD